jgi:hypothetical protein
VLRCRILDRKKGQNLNASGEGKLLLLLLLLLLFNKKAIAISGQF